MPVDHCTFPISFISENSLGFIKRFTIQPLFQRRFIVFMCIVCEELNWVYMIICGVSWPARSSYPDNLVHLVFPIAPEFYLASCIFDLGFSMSLIWVQLGLFVGIVGIILWSKPLNHWVLFLLGFSLILLSGRVLAGYFSICNPVRYF